MSCQSRYQLGLAAVTGEYPRCDTLMRRRHLGASLRLSLLVNGAPPGLMLGSGNAARALFHVFPLNYAVQSVLHPS